MQTSYNNQLKNFSLLHNMVNNIYQKVVSDQEDFVKKIVKYNIASGVLLISEDVHNELKAGVVELILDGLCWVEPKILDRKEGAYVAN
jgi:magnesium chelatase subunit I